MSFDDMCAVLRAYEANKEIQCRPSNSVRDWVDCIPRWDFSRYDYRIKPEPKKPREWVLRGNYADMTIKAVDGPCMEHGEIIRVREVLE